MPLFKKKVIKKPVPLDVHYANEAQNLIRVDEGVQQMNSLEYQDGNTIQLSSRYIVRSETNQRENNEDSFHIYDLCLTNDQGILKVLGIADGMGGHAYGEEVSRETLHKVSLALFEQLCVVPTINRLEEAQPIDADFLAQVMWSALQQANAHIRRMIQNNKWGKAGSTIVVAAILGHRVVVMNLGDSPLFHYQASTKRLYKITQDHTVAGVLLRARMISPEMALYHEGRSRLEFFVGAETLPREAPLYFITLAPRDLILLCSDGVTGALPHKQLEQIVSDPNSTLEAIAEHLFAATRQIGETDNQTLILWQQGGTQNERAGESPSTAETVTAGNQDTPTSIDLQVTIKDGRLLAGYPENHPHYVSHDAYGSTPNSKETKTER